MRCQPRATVASETGEGPTSETLELSREIDYHLLLLFLKKSVHQLSELKNRISHHGRSNVPRRFPMPVMGSCFGLYGCGIRGMLEQLGRCGKSWFLACWERRDVRALCDSQSTPSTSPVAYSTVLQYSTVDTCLPRFSWEAKTHGREKSKPLEETMAFIARVSHHFLFSPFI